MPTVYRYRGYRFFFYMADHYEPPHIHVEKADAAAKFWLSPIALAFNAGFTQRQLGGIEKVVARETGHFMAA